MKIAKLYAWEGTMKLGKSAMKFAVNAYTTTLGDKVDKAKKELEAALLGQEAANQRVALAKSQLAEAAREHQTFLAVTKEI